MPRKRRQHDARFKFKVALEAARGLRTINEIASENNVHPNQVSAWKKQLLEEGPAVFTGKSSKRQREQEATEADLYEQIGRLKMELEWLKKKLPPSAEAKRTMVEPGHSQLSIRRQCELLDLSRASYDNAPAGESPFNLLLMRLIDEQYTRTPFYGRYKMAAHLKRQGWDVNHKRVGRLMRKMGLQAVYPRPRTSIPDQQHQKYPYLLRGLDSNRPDQVWAAEITLVPLPLGFMYLVAIMDWFSRFVLAWQLSNTLDGAFCLDALRLALRLSQPEIFNTDQGVQFTAHDFVNTLEAAGIRVSMDGRGRVFDNIFVERLWRTVKYEDIYIKEYATVPALAAGLHDYFYLYNGPARHAYERPHQSLGYRTPADVYFAVKEPLLLSV